MGVPCCMFLAAVFPPSDGMLELAASHVKELQGALLAQPEESWAKSQSWTKKLRKAMAKLFLGSFTDPFHNVGSNRIQDAVELKLVKK